MMTTRRVAALSEFPQLIDYWVRYYTSATPYIN